MNNGDTIESRLCHPHCIACRPTDAGGLGLVFEPHDTAGVCALFECGHAYQGYPDRLHGGVIATLLDAAMTHCLFARQIRGVTAKLNVRYHRPARIERTAQVRAWVVGESPPLYLLRGELLQDGQLCASAEGTFFAE